MFRIDTGQARTDLYKADPLDFSNLQQAMSENKRMAYQEKQAKLKAQEERDADLYANMAKMDQMAIMPKDQANFALEAEAVRDYVRKNHDALVKNGDVNARMKFQELIGNYTQKAKLSADAQGQYQQVINEYGKNKDKFTRGTEEYLRDMGSTKTAGQWVIDPSQIVQRIDLQQNVLDELHPYAQAQAKKDIGKTTFTLEQAETTIENYFKDQARYRQLVEDFDDAEDKMGATDPISYAKKLYAPQLTVNDRSPIPEYYMDGGSKDKGPKVSAIVKHLGPNRDIATWEYTNPADNPFQQTGKGLLRPSVIHREGGKVWMEAIRPDDKEGNPGETLILTPEETHDFVYNKLGRTIDDVFSGESTKEMRVAKKDVSKGVSRGQQIAEKARAIAKEKRETEEARIAKEMGENAGKEEKAGGSYNIKGKKYTEKELIDMGYTVDQIVKYKEK